MKQKGNHIGCWVVLLIFVMVVLALVVTRPNKAAHREAMTEVVAGALSELGDSLTGGTAVVGGLALHGAYSSLATTVTHEVVERMLEVDDYGLCTVGHVHWDGRDVVVSVGVMSHVFTVDKQTVKSLVRTYVERKVDSTLDDIRDAAHGLLEKLLE